MADARALAEALGRAAANMPPTTVMEVCGTHTQSVARYALRQLLPPNLRLISGPGCPVCVTDDGDIARALWLTRQPGVTLLSFGDMLRVPVSGGDSLLRARERGADVRLATSPMDALRVARAEPGHQIVWLAVGFETTAPLTAALLARARADDVRNLTVLCAHKTMPSALLALLRGNRRVQALLCPGHVAAITGAEAFRFVPNALYLPAVVAGFTPTNILAALLEIVRMRVAGVAELRNAYPSAVTARGNRTAQALLAEVFAPCSARWRGLGVIDDSGLALRPAFADFDALARFAPPLPAPAAPGTACRCADILRGECRPAECPLFGKACTPDGPAGPCMVSAEGACASAYLYGGL